MRSFTLWAPTAVTITRGAERLGSYSKTPNSIRKWCQACGGHLFTEHPGFKLIDVYAATLPDLPFEPGVHVNYSDTVLHLRDGLPKLKDFPKELGGTGMPVSE